MNGRPAFAKSGRLALIVCSIAFLVFVQGCAGLRNEGAEEDLQQVLLAPPSPQPKAQSSVEEKWGVRILSARLTSRGYMVDFRYRVIDPEKASVLFARGVTPYLVDRETGARLSIPNAPKVGLLRAKGKPEASRDYFMLFGNSRGIVKKGNEVAVVAGDFKAENLVME